MSLFGKIIFNNNRNAIFSGDNINLLIEIENQEKLFIKEIFLRFFGEANCQWDDLVNRNKEGEMVYEMQEFKDREILVDKYISILNMDTLNAGTFLYNIVLNIPEQLPESVTWKYGSIKYELELSNCSNKGVESLFKMPLNVKRYLNIYLDRKYEQSFHTVFKKSFCWGICHIQPIKITLTLPKICCLPGDSLNYMIQIENFSKLLDLQQISIVLTQTQHYKVFKPFKSVKQLHTTLKQIKHNFNENHHNSKLQGLFSLPKNLIPSSWIECFLNISYNLHFILVFTGFHTDGFISVPLQIGSHRNDLEEISDFKRNETILKMGWGIPTPVD